MTIISRNINIETIIKKGMKPSEQKRQLRLESYLAKESTAKSFKTILQVKRKIAENLPKDATFTREDIIWMFKNLQDQHNKFEKEKIVETKVDGWHGKSSFEIIKEIDKLIIIKYQKKTKESEPEETRIEISKEELIAMVKALEQLSNEQPIKTSSLSMRYSNLLGIYHSGWKTGDKPIFCDRNFHNSFTLLLGALDSLGFIKYSGGNTRILNKLSVQEILN